MYTGLGRTAEELREDARILYANAQRAFDAGNFAGALSLFREAYRVVQNPTVVIAIAGTLFEMGRMDEAAASYRDYIRLAPLGPEVARAQERLRTISAGVPAQTARPATTRQTPAPGESAPSIVAPIVPRSPYGSSDVDSLVIIGVATAGVVAIGLAAWALSRRSKPNRRRRRSWRLAA